MTPPTAAGAASVAAPAAVHHPLVAGICVPGHHEADADAFLIDLAQHLAAAGIAPVSALTHFVPLDEARVVACSVVLDSDHDSAWTLLREIVAPAGAICLGAREHGARALLVAAGIAAAATEFGHSGRAVVFPGSDRLVGSMLVTEIVGGSAVDLVTVVGRGAADAGETVDTLGYVRPALTHGRLVLATRPAAGGMLVPADLANPTPCCAVHG